MEINKASEQVRVGGVAMPDPDDQVASIVGSWKHKKMPPAYRGAVKMPEPDCELDSLATYVKSPPKPHQCA